MELILKYFPRLGAEQLERFAALRALYTEWNKQINVISRKDIDDLYLHHVLHSLAIAKLVEFKPGARILDVGTGGGFPTIPLAIMFPETQFVAIDTIGKKIKVVEAISQSLALPNVQARQIQASQAEGLFDFVVARAVCKLSELLPWVWDKIRQDNKHALPDGVICLKGGDLKQEINEAKKQMQLQASQIIEYDIHSFFEEAFFETKKVVYIQASGQKKSLKKRA